MAQGLRLEELFSKLLFDGQWVVVVFLQTMSVR